MWARGATAVLLLGGAWLSTRSQLLVSVFGEATADVSAGVIAVSVLLGLRLPLDLWPRTPHRDAFSLPLSLLVAATLAALLVLTGFPHASYESLGVLMAVVVGGAAWAVACGRVDLRVSYRWYAIASAVGALPGFMGGFVVALERGLPIGNFGMMVRTAAFFLVVGATGSLVTQELAFRRVLVGQSGDAGLLTVILSAVVFAVWPLMAPGGASWTTMTVAFFGGIVAGALYMLSRSLLVAALFQGVQSAFLRGLEVGVGMEAGRPFIHWSMWITVVLVTAMTAGVLAYHANQRAGFLGALQRRIPSDAARD